MPTPVKEPPQEVLREIKARLEAAIDAVAGARKVLEAHAAQKEAS
jgi:hypothetical protein